MDGVGEITLGILGLLAGGEEKISWTHSSRISHLFYNGDAASLLPSQWLDRVTKFTPRQRFAFAHIRQAIDDWNRMQSGVPIRFLWTADDEEALAQWLFNPLWGWRDDGVLTLQLCCDAIGISVEDVHGECIEPHPVIEPDIRPLTDSFMVEFSYLIRGEVPPKLRRRRRRRRVK